MKIGKVDTTDNVYVIAEIGGNHNGNPDTAFRLVEAAADSGANAVKFQTYSAETLVHPDVEPVPIVKKHYATQLERFKSLELEMSVYEIIIQMCKSLEIDFMTTPFDVDILEKFSPYMPAIKISSGDLTYHKLISLAAKKSKPVILSTGMATIDDIRAAACFVPEEQLILMHCVSLYPLPDAEANIRAISTFLSEFNKATIGYSDHTIGSDACIAAVSLGARVIEKHFTLDTKQVPGDHVLSLDPQGLKDLVKSLKRVNRMLGTGVKQPSAAEMDMKVKMRRGIYARNAVTAGTVLSDNDLICIRPENGLPASEYENIVGRKLKNGLAGLQAIRLEDLE
jgi:sialic acid synthase SpsE